MFRVHVVVGCLLVAAPAGAQVVRLSVSSAGTQADRASQFVDISATGRYVVFDSEATNLVAGDTNDVPDIFLHDRDTDADGVFDEAGAFAVTRLNVGPGGVQANGPSADPAITPDGRYVVFVSWATNLVAGVPPDVAQIYRLDCTTGTMVLVSVSDAGVPGDQHSNGPVVSDDGNVVAFSSLASTIATGAATTTYGIFVREVGAGLTRRISRPGPTSESHYGGARISADGRRVLYRGTRIVRPLNVFFAVLHDRVTGTDTGFGLNPVFGAFLTASGGHVVTSGITSVTRSATNLATGEEFAWPPPIGSVGAIAISPSGRFVIGNDRKGLDLEYGSTATALAQFVDVAFDRGERWMASSTADATLVSGDTNGVSDVFVYPAGLNFDLDRDGLNDGWESMFGVTSPAADDDGDGATNAEEFGAGTHPHVAGRRFLAEGATGSFFTTDIALANPDPTQTAGVLLTFDTGTGTRVRRAVPVPARRSVAVHVGGIPGLESADFSTTIESNLPVGVSRTMVWDTLPTTERYRGYGMHAEAAVPSPSTTWFLAEGSTVLGFDLFYLLQNPQATAANATVRFLLPSGSVVTRTYALAPGSRTTVYVNDVPGLGETDVSGDVSADVPIVVERAMYRSLPGQPFGLGTESIGVTAPAPRWFLAEGATGAFFDLYVLIANPGGADAQVETTYAKPDGSTVTRQYMVRANSRFSVYVDAIPGLENTSVATTVTSTNSVPIVVERAMYWPGGFFDYYEGHSSAGTTTTARRWVVAAGEQSAQLGQTYVLIANTEARAGTATVTVLPSPLSGTAPPVTVSLPPNSRTTLEMTPFGIFEFGVLVESTGDSPVDLVVESAIYRTVGGVLWSAGANAPATPVP